ncbi:MAG: DUF1592 domain-containing protein [Planctomycetaceae bacterium]|nr:MAG: DUF1592 domain-containing protein [Planctomycetaceae bacterium]
MPVPESNRVQRLAVPRRIAAGGGRFRALMFGCCLASLLVGNFATGLRADETEERLAKWGADYERRVLPIIRDKCIECHSGEQPDGEFDLAKYTDGNSAVEGGDVWERVARRVRQNEMPPQGSPGLNDRQKSSFHRWVDSRPNQDLCRQLATDETQAWYKGHVMSRRLTAVEYRRAMNDLFGVPLLESETPPSDGGGGEGFDTVGDTLYTSTIHLESYLAIADRVVEAAIDQWRAAPTESDSRQRPEWFLVPQDSSGDGADNGTGDVSSDANAAARQTLARFARLAWRRPVAEAELDRLLELFTAAAPGTPYEVAIALPMKAVVLSPHFLFVVESQGEASGVQRLSPHQLATRLALLIWSSIPDELLLDAADRGDLYDDERLVAEVRRLLADPRAIGLGENFGLQWLGLRNFGEVRPDAELFPDFDAELSDAMRHEAVATVASVFRENRPLTDLIAADHAHANGRLAKHYGWELPADAPWQRVELADPNRGGVITMAGVLTAASYPRRTSPVLRGRWLLEELLGSRVPPPPENVPPLEEPDSSAPTATTIRQRLEIHRQNPECASCHDRMDPLGFGLENFDAIGRWRVEDQGLPIDATGELPSGDRFDGPGELKAILLGRSDEFAKHLVRKLLGFALGRSLNKFDQCVVDECLVALKENDYRAGVLIERIVLSYPFQYRYFK